MTKSDATSGGGGFRLPKPPVPMHKNVERDNTKPAGKPGKAKEK